MAISISLSASQTSYNTSTKTSYVYVYIIAYYSGGSFNRSAPLTVTVNGSQQSSTVSINGSESTSSGSTSIYSGTWSIQHDSTMTIYCHASLQAGGSTGTTTSSQAVTLTVPSSGSGGSSGGTTEEDDDIFEGGSSTSSAPHIIRILPGDHTSIKVISTGYGSVLTDGINVSNGYDLTVFFEVDDGYILDTHTINGTTVNSGESYRVYSNIAIRSSAIENPIDSALATKVYEDCTASGLTDIYMSIVHGYAGEGGELSPTDKTNVTKTSYSISNPIQVQWYYKNGNSAYSSEDYSYNHAYAITFTTPDTENISSLRFKFRVSDISTLSYDIYYSLTTSSANLTDYVYHYTDEYSIASGTISRSTLSSGSYATLDIESSKIESNKTYYLVLYMNNRSSSTTNSATLYYNSLSVGYVTGIYYIDNGSEYKAYQCHIYTAASYAYDVYEMFRDNGTGWDLVEN